MKGEMLLFFFFNCQGARAKEAGLSAEIHRYQLLLILQPQGADRLLGTSSLFRLPQGRPFRFTSYRSQGKTVAEAQGMQGFWHSDLKSGSKTAVQSLRPGNPCALAPTVAG